MRGIYRFVKLRQTNSFTCCLEVESDKWKGEMKIKVAGTMHHHFVPAKGTRAATVGWTVIWIKSPLYKVTKDYQSNISVTRHLKESFWYFWWCFFCFFKKKSQLWKILDGWMSLDFRFPLFLGVTFLPSYVVNLLDNIVLSQ